MATLYGVMAIFLWGGLALLGVNTTSIPAFQLLAMCFLISSLLMFVKRMLAKKTIFEKPELTMSQWVIGVGALFGFHFCYFIALKSAPAIEVSLISYIWPMLLAIFVSNKATIFKALIGGLVGFIGISFIIAGDNALSFNQDYIKGYLLALACAVIWSSYSWYLTKTTNKVDDIGWLSLAVSFFALFAHLFLESSYWQFNFSQWLGILLLGLGPVGGAFYLWDIGMKKGNQTLLASLSFSTPLISAVILALAGLNSWSSNIVIGLVLILVGVLIVNKPQVISFLRILS